ncbi:hypothetical protein KSP39_PZI012847 [Platanthera zijinensis]|uniref:Protein root UVB sensitive 2, chloroplastic n=1 Tax=Platanthera zijinensis TaxID=2320716 RepID=A0AAP0BBV9_9ASPA
MLEMDRRHHPKETRETFFLGLTNKTDRCAMPVASTDTLQNSFDQTLKPDMSLRRRNIQGMKDMETEDRKEDSNDWIVDSGIVSLEFVFCNKCGGCRVSCRRVKDMRDPLQVDTDSNLLKLFNSKYFLCGEGCLRRSRRRRYQIVSPSLLWRLSPSSLLFAAGLRPTPAQATAVSWILKDGMQHAGKLICSSMGARMDSEPKSWRILADVLYDLGSGLEILSPLCPQLFLELAGLGNFAKGMAVVAARATRLPIYSSFAKEGNLSDLFAKGEAISTLSNVIGIGAGIQLASTVCSTMQGKLIVAPLLSAIHIYSVAEEMRAAPVNTLNPQRTAMIVADFLKSGQVSSPGELRYRENLLFPDRIVEEAGSVAVGQPLRKVVKSASKLEALRALFPGEKFVIRRRSRRIDMILEKSANGEDALRGWLVAAYSRENELAAGVVEEEEVVGTAYRKMEKVFPGFISEVKSRGWHTDQFLDGNGSRFAVQHDGSKCF